MLSRADHPPIIQTGTGTPEANLLLAVLDKAIRDANYDFEGNYPYTPSTAASPRLDEAQAALEIALAEDGEAFVLEINYATRYEVELTPDEAAPHILRAIAARLNDRTD